MFNVIAWLTHMKPTIISSDQKSFFDFGGLAVTWKIDGPESQGRFSVVHHPIAPHALAAPASGSISRSRSCKLKTETDGALEFKRMGGGPGRYTSDIQFFDLYPKTYCRPQSHIISMMGWMATIRSATRFTRFHSCSFISRSSEKGTT